MGYSEWLHVDFRVISQETEKDFKIVTTDNKIYWVPKKVVADRRDYKAGDRNGTISIREWFAEKEGWL